MAGTVDKDIMLNKQQLQRAVQLGLLFDLVNYIRNSKSAKSSLCLKWSTVTIALVVCDIIVQSPTRYAKLIKLEGQEDFVKSLEMGKLDIEQTEKAVELYWEFAEIQEQDRVKKYALDMEHYDQDGLWDYLFELETAEYERVKESVLEL